MARSQLPQNMHLNGVHTPALAYPFTTVELILVRHALPIRRENSVGPADPELSQEGHAQAQLFADYISTENIDALYTSPLQRARQTADPLASIKAMSPIVVDGIAEFDQHSNEYIPVEELKAANDPRWMEMINGTWTTPDEAQEFTDRVIDSLEMIVSQHRGGRVVVTCHGGVINEYLAHVLGLENRQFFYPNYTSIHRIAASSNGHRSILSINEVAHLRNSGLLKGLFNG
jgi:probable phosphoglycerate mutase